MPRPLRQPRRCRRRACRGRSRPSRRVLQLPNSQSRRCRDVGDEVRATSAASKFGARSGLRASRPESRMPTVTPFEPAWHRVGAVSAVIICMSPQLAVQRVRPAGAAAWTSPAVTAVGGSARSSALGAFLYARRRASGRVAEVLRVPSDTCAPGGTDRRHGMACGRDGRSRLRRRTVEQAMTASSAARTAPRLRPRLDGTRRPRRPGLRRLGDDDVVGWPSGVVTGRGVESAWAPTARRAAPPRSGRTRAAAVAAAPASEDREDARLCSLRGGSATRQGVICRSFARP